MTPKNLRTAIKPDLPNAFSIQFSDLITAKITIRLASIASRIMYSFLSCRSKVALSDMIVVSVPLPAIKGKAIGTTVPEGVSLSDLKNSIPSTISSPRIKITIDPATAKDRMSTPNIFRKGFPMKKKSTMSAPEIIVTFAALMCPDFCFMLTSMGTEPTTSITANKVNASVRNSCKLKENMVNVVEIVEKVEKVERVEGKVTIIFLNYLNSLNQLNHLL